MKTPVVFEQRQVQFFVIGLAKSTQTGSVHRVVRGGRTFLIPSRRNPEWSATIGKVARDYAPERPFDGALEVEIVVLLPMSKTKRRFPTTRPDVQNFEKGVLDSLNHVIYEDDSQIVDLILRKRYACSQQDRVGMSIRVTEIAPVDLLRGRVRRAK